MDRRQEYDEKRKELISRRRLLEKKQVQRDANAAEFSALHLHVLRRTQSSASRRNADAKKRNDMLLTSMAALLERLQSCKDTVASRALHKANIKFQAQVEAVYPAWQHELQTVKLSTLAQLDREKTETDQRRLLAKKVFAKEQALTLLLAQKRQDLEIAKNLERSEALERQFIRNKVTQEGKIIMHFYQFYMFMTSSKVAVWDEATAHQSRQGKESRLHNYSQKDEVVLNASKGVVELDFSLPRSAKENDAINTYTEAEKFDGEKNHNTQTIRVVPNSAWSTSHIFSRQSEVVHPLAMSELDERRRREQNQEAIATLPHASYSSSEGATSSMYANKQYSLLNKQDKKDFTKEQDISLRHYEHSSDQLQATRNNEESQSHSMNILSSQNMQVETNALFASQNVQTSGIRLVKQAFATALNETRNKESAETYQNEEEENKSIKLSHEQLLFGQHYNKAVDKKQLDNKEVMDNIYKAIKKEKETQVVEMQEKKKFEKLEKIRKDEMKRDRERDETESRERILFENKQRIQELTELEERNKESKIKENTELEEKAKQSEREQIQKHKEIEREKQKEMEERQKQKDKEELEKHKEIEKEKQKEMEERLKHKDIEEKQKQKENEEIQKQLELERMFQEKETNDREKQKEIVERQKQIEIERILQERMIEEIEKEKANNKDLKSIEKETSDSGLTITKSHEKVELKKYNHIEEIIEKRISLEWTERVTVLSSLFKKIEDEVEKTGQIGYATLEEKVSNDIKRNLMNMAKTGRVAQLSFYGSDICCDFVLELVAEVAQDLFPKKIFEGKMSEEKLKKVLNQQQRDLWQLLCTHIHHIIDSGRISSVEIADIFTPYLLYRDTRDDRFKRKMSEFLQALFKSKLNNDTNTLSSSKEDLTKKNLNEKLDRNANQRNEINTLSDTSVISRESSKLEDITIQKEKKIVFTRKTSTTDLTKKLLQGSKFKDHSEFEEEEDMDLDEILSKKTLNRNRSSFSLKSFDSQKSMNLEEDEFDSNF